MNRVKELRARAGMMQKELALAIGVSHPTVSEWEHQKKDPTGERLNRLTEIFCVNRGVILCYEDITNPVPVLFVDDGTTDATREIEEARRLVKRDPERGTLFAMATSADIKNVRRAIAVLNALQDIE